MHAILTRPDGSTIHTRLDVRPARYSHAALGGPDTSELAVSGDKNALSDVLNWLACRVVIYNESALPVWWGLVQAVTVTLDGVAYGLDASQIVNRMAVVYSDEAGNPAQTTWVEDAHSVALYGRRETRMSVKAETNTTALAQATRIVNERAAPLRSVSGAGGEDGARLACVGYWRTLGWRYWSQSVGLVERDEGVNASELIGWSLTDTDIGFNKPLQKLSRQSVGLALLAEADRVDVDGSVTSDAVYEITDSDARAAVTTYTDDGIYFDATDDIHDADGVLNQFLPGDLIDVDGSADNDGIYFLKDVLQNSDGLYDHMRVHPGTIIDEAAGATVTLEAGNAVGITPRPGYELPGATITVRSQATKIAMTVNLNLDACELSEIWIQAARVGSPADNLKIELCANDGGGGMPGTVLNSATVSGASLPLLEAIDWVQWSFDHAVPATHTTYYVVVSRTGSADDADCYRIGLREAAEGFTSADVLWLYDGSSWIGRTVASGLEAALGLRIYAQRVTTDQIADIVTGVGDWLAGTRIGTASGLRTRRYRGEEQAQTALSEIEALLEFGTSGGARLLARVSADRVLLIDTAPASTTPGYIWTADGLRDRWGVPLAPGLLPVGEWVAFDVAGASGVFAPAFVEAAEFDVASGSVRPSFRSEQPVQALARLASPASVPDLAVRLRPLL